MPLLACPVASRCPLLLLLLLLSLAAPHQAAAT
jgi:hypothetical protein